MNSEKNIILVGGGGHCHSVIDVIEVENKYRILGIIDSDNSKKNILGYPILGNDDVLSSLIQPNHFFLVTVGQIKSYSIREQLVNQLNALNANWATVISPLAYVSKHSTIQLGTVVLHHALINTNVEVGMHSIINTKSTVEHDSKVGNFCHISTGAMVNGNCTVSNGTFIGSNATISHGVSIPENSIIGAGKFVKS